MLALDLHREERSRRVEVARAHAREDVLHGQPERLDRVLARLVEREQRAAVLHERAQRRGARRAAPAPQRLGGSPATLNWGSAIGGIGAAVAGGALATAATSTPKSSGSVCAVTSYGRLGGPPGYSRRFGYLCRASRD